jgi:hypothetical protein
LIHSSIPGPSYRRLVVLLTCAVMLSLAPLVHANASASTEGQRQLCSAIPTVKRWLGYLEKSKSRRAWRLMTEPSRRAVGGFDQFKKESSAWAEGWGAWARARRRDFELRVIAPMDGDAASVVTMTGRVAREGPFRRSAEALPIITREGVTKVDPIHGRARIEAVRPRVGDSLARRPQFKAIVRRIRARYNSVYFVVKGANPAPQEAKLHRIRRRSYKATLRWPHRLRPGRHELTIASWGRNGFKAEAVGFKVNR